MVFPLCAVKAPQLSVGTADKLQRVLSSHLFQGKPEILIRHDDQEYRLRITKQNKLILTK